MNGHAPVAEDRHDGRYCHPEVIDRNDEPAETGLFVAKPKQWYANRAAKTHVGSWAWLFRRSLPWSSIGQHGDSTGCLNEGLYFAYCRSFETLRRAELIFYTGRDNAW